MFRRIVFAAFAAGLVVGLITTVLQELVTTPLILEAEKYEGKEHPASLSPSALRANGQPDRLFVLAAEHGVDAEDEGWAPADGLERSVYSALANIVVAVGYALLLIGCFALYGKPVTARQGVIWGVAGFAVFTLGPALGLPPEVPGAMAADLVSRQIWWLSTVAASAIGLWLLVFPSAGWLKALGVMALIAPHAVGAPHPAQIGGAVPPEIAGHFAAASIVLSAVFWALLGWFGGAIYDRLGRRADA